MKERMKNNAHLIEECLNGIHSDQSDFVPLVLERILAEAARSEASDAHFQPAKNGMEVRFRQDGVLHVLGMLPQELTAQFAARLKVLANLLTYQIAVPQEGRIRSGVVPGVDKEMRVSTVPTLYGERVVVRFFSEETRYQYADELGLPPDIRDRLLQAARRNSGAILLTGPSGSGKTTTAYALLRELADRGETTRSIVTLEDPIEHALEGIAQVEIRRQNDLTLDAMIKYMMRQDPEVLFVGEIRDRATAEAAMQAALTGHLLITTFHAGSAAESVGRLYEIGIEPFALRSGISCVLCQRLVRKLCPVCAEKHTDGIALTIGREHCVAGRSVTAPFEITEYSFPKGCGQCNGTGYAGRVLLAESLPLENVVCPEYRNANVMRALFDRPDMQAIGELAVQNGMIPMSVRAVALIESHVTSPQEIRRVFG